jgi:hypothetical protein
MYIYVYVCIYIHVIYTVYIFLCNEKIHGNPVSHFIVMQFTGETNHLHEDDQCDIAF